MKFIAIKHLIIFIYYYRYKIYEDYFENIMFLVVQGHRVESSCFDNW